MWCFRRMEGGGGGGVVMNGQSIFNEMARHKSPLKKPK